jgi:hypothetical protein
MSKDKKKKAERAEEGKDNKIKRMEAELTEAIDLRTKAGVALSEALGQLAKLQEEFEQAKKEWEESVEETNKLRAMVEASIKKPETTDAADQSAPVSASS